MQRLFRDLIFAIETGLAIMVGSILRLFPHASRRGYRRLIAWNRALPDRATLWLNPFVTTLGTALFDLRGEAIETLAVAGGGSMQLDIGEKTQRQIFSQKMFEAGVSRFVLTTLREGDIFVDVGANVGYFTILSAPIVGKRGKVIALEPEKKNFAALARHAKGNGYGQIALYNCAAGAEAGTLTLNINPLNHGGNSLVPFATYASGQERYSAEEIRSRYSADELFEEVEVRTLDDLLEEQGIAQVAILKIDVEGFEASVLAGAREMIRRKAVHHIICEVNNDTERESIFALFAENGYAPSRISFGGAPVPLPIDVPIAKLHGNVLFSIT
jgi:FkbM family methyltransferase